MVTRRGGWAELVRRDRLWLLRRSERIGAFVQVFSVNIFAV